MSNLDITDKEINAVEPIYVDLQDKVDLDIQLKDSGLRYLVATSTLTIENDKIKSIGLSFNFEFYGRLKSVRIDGVDTPPTPPAVVGYLLKNVARFAEMTQNEFVSELKDLIQK